MVTVAVNDRPLPVAAIVREGRVLLPMRATFAALGASVRYDPRGRVVVAKTASHRIRLKIGSRTAWVDGASTRLDVPPQIAAARTFVPLRFVAQALGASVGYDAPSTLVTIATPDRPHAVKVSLLDPAPQSQVATAYPNVSASLDGATANRARVALTIDGEDVTPLATFDGSTITYLPRTALAAGTHTVAFDGQTVSGTPFSMQWAFTTTATPPNEQGANVADYGYQFYQNGPSWYQYGDFMHFTLIAPPGGSAYLQLCGLGYAYPFWNGGNGMTYIANIPAPYGYWLPACQVSAYYTAWNGLQYYVPLPIFIGLYTLPQQPYQIAAPGASSVPPGPPRVLPPDKRRTEPETSTSPARLAAPQPVHAVPVHDAPVHAIPVHAIPVHEIPVHPIPAHVLAPGPSHRVHPSMPSAPTPVRRSPPPS